MPETPPRPLDRVHAGLRAAVRATLACALLLTAFRIVFLLRHAAPGFPYEARDVARTLLMGARFDLKVSAIASIPLLLLVPLFPGGRGRILPAAWAMLSGFALVLTAMINDGYYGYYHVPIDPIIFGVFEDETAFNSMKDHPVVLGTVAALVISLALAWSVLRGALRGAPSRIRRVLVLVLVPPLLFLAMRGRVAGYPLQRRDFAVSTDSFLNAAVPNGAYALHTALKERNSVAIGKDPYAGLRAQKFATPAQAAAVLGLTSPEASDDAVAEALYTRTPENAYAAAHPPHVVVVILEGIGTDLLSFHSPTNDLLGRFAPHLPRGLVWKNFLSAQNGTHKALEALLLSTPITPLTTGEPGAVEFEQSWARPFRAAGYRTVFAQAWSGAWRGWGRTLPRQGFDEARDRSDVLAVVPDPPMTERGIGDEALFRWAERRLREADGKGERLFLVLMTATNHPPHRRPPGYALRPLDPNAFAGRVTGEPALRDAILETFQYTCDALGGFLDTLERDGVLSRSVLAVTGDHTTRGFFEYPGVSDLQRRDGVLFWLSAPAPYLAGRTPDLDRWASHRDLFPTLAALVLPRARVFRSGEDLLAPPIRTPRALYHYDTVLSAAGAVPDLDRSSGHCWGADGKLASTPGGACASALDVIRREERAYVGLLDWNVRRQAIAARGKLRSAVASGGDRSLPQGTPTR